MRTITAAKSNFWKLEIWNPQFFNLIHKGLCIFQKKKIKKKENYNLETIIELLFLKKEFNCLIFDSYIFRNSLLIQYITRFRKDAKSAEYFHEHPVLSQTSRTREETGLRGSLEVVDSWPSKR